MVLMRGATVVRRGVIAYLMDAIPKQFAHATSQWGLSDSELLEKPTTYSLYEVDGFSHNSGPLVAVDVGRASGMTQVDYGPSGAEQYRITYAVRVVVWLFTPKTEDEKVPDEARVQTVRARDDLGAVVRSALLASLSLGQNEVFQLQVSSLTEDYHDLMPVPNNSGRMVTGATFSFNLDVDESQYRDTLGQVPESGIVIVGALLPTGEQ